MFNKKGIGFDDIPAVLVTIIFIVIIVFLFAGYQKYRENTKYQAIDMIKRDIEADEQLLDYLQKSTTFDINNDGSKEKITIADLIIFSFLKDNYDYLEEETKKILLDAKKSDISGWNVRMYLTNKEKVSVDTYPLGKSRAKSSQSSTFLPLGKDDKYIEIRLYKSVQVYKTTNIKEW